MHEEIAKQIEELVDIHDRLDMGLKLSEEECQFLNEHFERVEIGKKQFIVEEGGKEKYIYFIEEGIFRYWTYNLKMREITFWFSFPKEFANSHFLLRNDRLSAFNIQAISDSVVWRMKSDDLLKLYANSFNVSKIARVVLKNALVRKVQREISLLTLTPEERYKELMEFNKAMILTIPLKYLASYLGVTPQALSRIRKRMY